MYTLINNITVQPPSTNCGQVCEQILRALPGWFGIEESLVQYVKDADTMQTMLVKDKNEVITDEILIPVLSTIAKYPSLTLGKVYSNLSIVVFEKVNEDIILSPPFKGSVIRLLLLKSLIVYGPIKEL